MREDKDLEPFLAAARGDRPQPSEDLMARVLADAYAVQPAAAGRAFSAASAPTPRRGLWSALAGVFGGSGALAGLGTAALAGVWLGYADPPGLDWLTGTLVPSLSGEVQLLQADTLFLTEG